MRIEVEASTLTPHTEPAISATTRRALTQSPQFLYSYVSRPLSEAGDFVPTLAGRKTQQAATTLVLELDLAKELRRMHDVCWIHRERKVRYVLQTIRTSTHDTPSGLTGPSATSGHCRRLRGNRGESFARKIRRSGSSFLSSGHWARSMRNAGNT